LFLPQQKARVLRTSGTVPEMPLKAYAGISVIFRAFLTRPGRKKTVEALTAFRERIAREVPCKGPAKTT